MKRLFCTLFFSAVILLGLGAQENSALLSPYYLEGAVPVKNGMVEFETSFSVPEKSQSELFELLKNYTQTIVENPDRLPRTRITELSPDEGVIAASVEEYLWFKRKAWVWDRAQLSYQLVFQISDGNFKATMRRLTYFYEPMIVENIDSKLKAEDWITDQAALSRDGKHLKRVSGKKFRVKTIDRKNQIFKGAAEACGLKLR